MSEHALRAGPHRLPVPSELVASIGSTVVGRRREIELVVAALVADRHVVIEGPPGTGKSTLLRTVAHELGVGFEFVEGNAELTPARLVGHFDPGTGDGRGL
jgi:MoxR-like ATPase